jgi:PKD domain
MILAVLVVALGGSAVGATAAVGDVGTRDFNYAPLTGTATGNKPESKLWFADGIWWSTMFQPASLTWRIFRLDRASQTWNDTGTDVDERIDTRSDTLWDPASNKLYIATHIVSASSGAPGPGARLYRFSYDPASKRYTRDAGFPVAINGATSETLTLDQDSTGALWATWAQGNAVYVAHTFGSDTVWDTPYVIPGATGLDPDDISSLVHFAGDRVGVLWSNQVDHKTYFAIHADGTGDAAANWSVSQVPTGLSSDDHVNLKADSAGRVYAALKTSEDSITMNPAPTRPLVILAVRSTTGVWSRATVGTIADDQTRPIVELDEQHGNAYVVMTCGNTGGFICYKRSPLSRISFAGGRGTTLIRDDLTVPPDMNDATSTKQEVNGATGLVVMSNVPSVDTYWHGDLSLGSAPPAVTADFTSSPATGGTPLVVSFHDASANLPTNWRWDFGDGHVSVGRNPSHVYTAPGMYTVRLTAANASSSATVVRTAAVTVVGPPSPPGGGGGGGGGSSAGGGSGGSGSVLGSTAGKRRTTVRLFKRNLRRHRVRLSGSVSPRLNGVRVTLQRRSSTGRWSKLRTAKLHRLGTSRSQFLFVVKRLSRTVRYRIVVPAGTGRSRAQSAALKVRRR